MEMIKRLTQGRHCTWWAEKTLDPPSQPKQQILRGFPAQGIPFPKGEDIPRCDVCPHPKPLKRGPLPGWFSYGIDRRKAPSPHPRTPRDERQKADLDSVGSGAIPHAPVGKKRKGKGKKKDEQKYEAHEFVRHDGHFKQPERKRIVTFVKQYRRRSSDSQPPQKSDKMIDYGADNDMKMLAVPTCGVNCYQIRQNVYKAVDELLSKQPEVVRIRPRARPKELMEMQKLRTLPIKEANATGSQVRTPVEGEPKPSRSAVAVTSVEQKVEAYTQTQSPPSSVAEAPSLAIAAPAAAAAAAVRRPISQFRTTLVPHQPKKAGTPSVASLLMEVGAMPATHAPEAPADTSSQNGPQLKITTLLFPQPRLAATPVPEGEAASSKGQHSTEWRDPLGLLALTASSSSLESREMMQSVRGRQREKHWEREKVNSAIIYRDSSGKAKAKASHDQEGTVDLLRQGWQGVAGQQPGEKAQRVVVDATPQDLEMKLRLNSILERLTLEATASAQEAKPLQDRDGSRAGGLQDLLMSAEDFGRRDVGDSQAQQGQQLPINSCDVSPTELEYMKAAILNHNFYSRLVSSFIEQNAAGAPPETLAKLEQVRWQVMQTWNPNHSVECDEKIKKYQDILTKFESELEKPFQEAMDYSFKSEHMFKSLPSAQKRKHDRVEEEEEGEEKEEDDEEIPVMFS